MAKRFGQYEILEELGRGGMGVVYKARQVDLDRVVALKVMHPGIASPEALARFQREMKVLGKLRHPNIVRLLGVGKVGDHVYFTMDYIEGQPLSSLIGKPKSRVSRARLVRHVATVARAVHYAHKRGIIHRDLKPSNIIIDAEGTPFITDFGLAKELGAEQTVTVSGATIGTAAYMSPEQAEGRSDAVGPRSDVYALGAILYEVLTGRPPFRGATPAAVLRKVCREVPTPPRRLSRSVRQNLEAICLKCLEKDPADRYPSAKALARDLERDLGRAAVEARSSGPTALLGRAARAHPGLAAAAVCAAVALAVAIVVVLGGRHREPTRLTQEQVNSRRRELESQRQAKKEGVPAVPQAPRREEKLESLPQARQAAQRAFPLATARAVITSYHGTALPNCIAVAAGEVWLGYHGGARVLSIADGTTVFYPLVGSVGGIAHEGGGVWWFASDRKGVHRFDGREWTNYTKADGLADNEVRDVAVDGQGRKWFATDSGVSCLHDQTWWTYTVNGGLGAMSFSAITQDRAGRVWLGTNGSGVWRLDGEAWTVYVKGDGLPRSPSHMSAMVVDPQGRVLVGASQGAWCFDGKRWKAVTKLLDKSVCAMAVDSKGRIWVGTHEGAFCFDGQGWRRYMTTDGPPTISVKAIAEGPDGSMWFGTSTKGVTCFDGKTWRTYTREDGLAGSGARAIAVGPKGRMWFASGGGVCCFDGSTWREYTTKDGLGGTSVSAIAADRQGRLWFGTRKGVTCFDGSTWKSYTKRDGLAHDWVSAIAVGRDGRLWVATWNGLSSFDGRSWAVHAPTRQLASRDVREVLVDGDDRKWFVTSLGTGGSVPQYAFSCFDGSRWRSFTTWDLGEADHEEWRIHGLAVGRRGALWFAGSHARSGKGRQEVWRYDGKSLRAFSGRDGLGGSQVRDIIIDGEGTTWATTDAGVYCFDGQAWKGYTEKDGLPANDVGPATIDDDGRKWFGTARGAVCFDGQRWRHYPIEGGARPGLGGEPVQAIAVDGAGRKWFVQPKSVLCLDGDALTVHSPTGIPADARLGAVAVDGEGSMWLAGRNTGVLRLRDGSWEQHRIGDVIWWQVLKNDTWDTQLRKRGTYAWDRDGFNRACHEIHAVAVDARGRKWLGCWDGLWCLDGDSWTRYRGGFQDNPTDAVRTIAFDGQGRKWIGGTSNIACFDDETWRTFTRDDGLPSGYCNGALKDKQGRMWFIKGGSLVCFDGTKWTSFAPDKGTGRHYWVALAVDNRGRKWLGSPGSGVWCFDGKTWRTWTARDYLAGNRVHCLAIDLDGSIWVGTETGVSHIVLKRKD